MNIVLDMNISYQWVNVLQAAGYTCKHWIEIGPANATDAEIFDWAKTNNYIIFTHDLDFGAILASSNSSCPSVIQIRRTQFFPDNSIIVQETLQYLSQFEESLSTGALITIDEFKAKVRILPFKN